MFNRLQPQAAAAALLIICCCATFGTVDGGVKIEISRVKDPPPKPSNDDKSVPHELATDSAEMVTTMPTTFAIETTTMLTKPMIESNFKLLSNTTTTTSVDTTTISPPNLTDPIRPAQINPPNTIPTKNVTQLQPTDSHPYLSEFTRRQMRRKLIPPDYYCPCDLKVNNPLSVFEKSYERFNHKNIIILHFFPDKFLWYQLLLWHWLCIERNYANIEMCGPRLVDSWLRRIIGAAVVFADTAFFIVLHRW